MVRAVRPTEDTLWRVGRTPDPLTPSRVLTPNELNLTDVGYRFDSATAHFRVLYAGSNLDACFAETLAQFRPELELIAVVKDEWRDMGFMNVGAVPRAWREDKMAVEFGLDLAKLESPDEAFVDVEDIGTLNELRLELAEPITALGYGDLDIGLMRGPDRRVTRLVSDWAFAQQDARGYARYAGIRYLSRLGSRWECWAIFDDIPILDSKEVPVTLDMKPLEIVAKTFGLRVF